MSIELPILFKDAPPGYYVAIHRPSPVTEGPDGDIYINPALLKKHFQKDEVINGIVKGEYNHWKHLHVKALDKAKNTVVSNDGLDDSRDLVALYAHEGENNNPYSFRVDLHDLKFGAEAGNLDIYLLITWGGSTGTTLLPDNKKGKTEKPWALCVKIDNVNKHEVITLDGKSIHDAVMAVGFHAGVDAVQFALDKAVLRSYGWKDSQPLILQAFTAKDNDFKVADFFKQQNYSIEKYPKKSYAVGNNFITHNKTATFLPMEITTKDQTGQGRLAYVWHGNQELKTVKELNDLVDNNNGTGFIHLLDSIERWKIPMELHISGTLQSGIKWSKPEFLTRINKLVNDGLVTIQGGTFDEQIMVYFPGEINHESLKYGAKWAKELTKKLSEDKKSSAGDILIGWTPERIINSEILKDFKKSGYKATIADYINKWFENSQEDHKVHRINDMDIFFIDHELQQKMVEIDDEGLDSNLRKTLLEDAINNKHDVMHLGFNDWELVAGFPFLSPVPLPFIPKNFDKICRWLASHPWIEVTTPTKFLSRSPKVVDHGSGHNLPTQTYLGKDIPHEWYYGSPNNESYFDYVPLDRGWDFGKEKDQIKSKKKIGDQKTPGTIIHDTWMEIKNAPENPLKELAKLAFFTHIYETAWHDQNMPRDTSPDMLAGANRISGWERDLAAQIRQNKILVEAACWAENMSIKTKNMPIKLKAENKLLRTENVMFKTDLNQDLDDEVIVTTDKLFLVFSPVGGKLVFAAVYDPQKGPIPMMGNFLAMPVNEGEAEVNPELAKKNPKDASKRLSGFRDSGYDDDIYHLEINKVKSKQLKTEDVSITATSSDGKIQKKFIFKTKTNTIESHYKLSDDLKDLVVGIGLSPNLLDLFNNGQKNLLTKSYLMGTKTMGETVCIENTQGGKGILSLNGATLIKSHRNFPQTHALYARGGKEFTISLGLFP